MFTFTSGKVINGSSLQVSIYDLFLKKVLSKEFTNLPSFSQNTVKIDLLESGNYIVQFQLNNQIITKKITKSKT